jgi:hypothetical protein
MVLRRNGRGSTKSLGIPLGRGLGDETRNWNVIYSRNPRIRIEAAAGTLDAIGPSLQRLSFRRGRHLRSMT